MDPVGAGDAEAGGVALRERVWVPETERLTPRVVVAVLVAVRIADALGAGDWDCSGNM